MMTVYFIFLQPEKVISTQDDAQLAALRQSFNQIAGQDLEIDAYELQDILNTAFKRGIFLNNYWLYIDGPQVFL